jgi:hypothetical protein
MMGKRKNTSKVAVMRSVARAILLELTLLCALNLLNSVGIYRTTGELFYN